MDGAKVFLLLQLLSCAYGKHLPKPHHNERKSYPRQMIIPNKFIPMLKQSSLFKSRSSSNDLSSFLQPMSHEHDSVTGQTRQNLMNSMGMDPGQSQGAGTGDTNGMGGMGQAGGMGDAGGMGGMGGAGGMGEGGMNGMGGAGGMGMNGGMGGMGGAGGMGMNGGMGGMSETGGMGMNGGMGGTGMEGAGGFGGLNDQMKAMNEIGGMGNSDASQSPLGGNMQGENGMDPMNNGGAEGMNSDANNPPAGDPMGTLKDMLSNQGTNAALGTDSQAFGPGGSANSNVLAMLNQIVGKEMPGESPVDPSSSSEQVWNRLQKTFDSQKPSGVPYIDQNANEHVQQDIQVSNSNNKMNVADKPNPNTPAIPINNNSTPNISTKKPPISNPENASPLNANSATSNAPMAHASTDSPATNPTSTTNIISKPRSQKESHANALTKTTSNMAEMDTEEDRPLSADMIKFLKGVKFVVSQEPGNDIILGKKFSSDVQHDLTLDFKEENGVIKNIVSATNKLSRADRMWPMNTSKWERGERYGNVETANPKGIASSFAVTHLLSTPNAKKKNPVEYIKAAKVLERASKKLKDPIAKKSTEIAVASILKVAHALGENKNLSSNAAVDLLNGGDVNNKLSEKYIEAARVLGTASKKLADPVAKKSTEIGIASILKVIALGDYPTSKKTFVPSLPRSHSLFNTHLNTLVDKRHENIANEIVVAVKRTLKLPKMKKPSH